MPDRRESDREEDSRLVEKQWADKGNIFAVSSELFWEALSADV